MCGYIAGTTGRRLQDVIWTLQSYSMCQLRREVLAVYTLYKRSVVDSETDVCQISRCSAFMHVPASSIRLQISTSLSPPGSTHDPRYERLNHLHLMTKDWAIDGAPEVIQGSVSWSCSN